MTTFPFLGKKNKNLAEHYAIDGNQDLSKFDKLMVGLFFF